MGKLVYSPHVSHDFKIHRNVGHAFVCKKNKPHCYAKK